MQSVNFYVCFLTFCLPMYKCNYGKLELGQKNKGQQKISSLHTLL
jgi:hypothetical protein